VGSVTHDPHRVAEDFIEFCNGLEEAGLPEFARRGRVVARLLIEAVDELDAERSARRAIQERAEGCEEILRRRAGEAAAAAA
jgi:hypothetical protein